VNVFAFALLEAEAEGSAPADLSFSSASFIALAVVFADVDNTAVRSPTADEVVGAVDGFGYSNKDGFPRDKKLKLWNFHVIIEPNKCFWGEQTSL